MQIEQFKGLIGELSTTYPSNLEIIFLDISRFYESATFFREREKEKRQNYKTFNTPIDK